MPEPVAEQNAKEEINEIAEQATDQAEDNKIEEKEVDVEPQPEQPQETKEEINDFSEKNEVQTNVSGPVNLE